jgi:hypothetical protein
MPRDDAGMTTGIAPEKSTAMTKINSFRDMCTLTLLRI